jgi:hypothetical protein
MTEHLSERVSTVERNLDGLREANARTQAQLSGLATESAQHTRDLHDIKEALTSHQSESRTNWEVIGVWLGVAIVISTLAFAPVYRDLGKVEEEQHDRTSLIIEQAYENGKLEARVKALEERID